MSSDINIESLSTIVVSFYIQGTSIWYKTLHINPRNNYGNMDY